MRCADIYLRDRRAGVLEELDRGVSFTYLTEYLDQPDAEPVALSLPLRREPYAGPHLPTFFDGLLPEGWLLALALDSFGLRPMDRFGILLATGHDTIGAVRVIPSP